MFGKLLPREGNFFEMFNQHADRIVEAARAFEQLVARVVGFVEEPGRGLELPLDVRGTAFQQRVWQALRTIPAGTTAAYGYRTEDRLAQVGQGGRQCLCG